MSIQREHTQEGQVVPYGIIRSNGMKMNKKTDSGKPFQGGEICSSGRSLLGECYHLNKAVQLHGAHSVRHKAALDLAERKETGCRGGK